jgi:hypothetical protein
MNTILHAILSRLCTFAFFIRRSLRRSRLKNLFYSLFNIVLRIFNENDMISRSSLQTFEKDDDFNIHSDKIFSRFD